MAKIVRSRWMVPFFFLCLNSVQSAGASEVPLDVSLSRRRALQQDERQEKILLEFRQQVKYKAGTRLTSWGEGNGSVCNGWEGVTCDGFKRVVRISLEGQQLEGTISPVLGQLQFLEYLDLSDNGFRGVIPNSLGLLQAISHLDLSINKLSGQIPSELHNCSSLLVLDLSYNSLDGWIPPSLGMLQSLKSVHLSSNSLWGIIPVELGNCSALTRLRLNFNGLYGGIPFELGNLQFLEELDLSTNALSDPIPTSVGNLSFLLELQLGFNGISGSIPSEIGKLTRLRSLSLASNMLQMRIPESLGNCVLLTEVDLGRNNLAGPIPSSLGFIVALEILKLEFNTLNGSIPPSLSRLRQLRTLLLNNNNFTGRIPRELGFMPGLVALNLGYNQLSGPMYIPDGGALIEVRLNDNFLTGDLPTFQPTHILALLNVSRNRLTGVIPPSIVNISNAEFIDFSFNNLTGPIPSNLGFLKALRRLDLSDNGLSGAIPSSLGSLPLTFVDVSNNNLAGDIPSAWHNFPPEFFWGNPRLCGLPIQVVCSPWPGETSSGTNRTWIYIGVAIGTLVSGIAVLSAAIWCTWRRKSYNAQRKLAPIMEMSNFSDGFVLTPEDVITATNDFSEANIIGEGSKSVVYKGVLPGGMVVAVKKLIMEHSTNERWANSLNHEMQMLGTLHHENWLQVYGFLSSPETKALVLEYAPNGSLHHQLHSADSCQLSWKMRLEMAKGIAEALVHIHHELARPIIHLDLKPSNVLLDENFVAKVADLGISKLVSPGSSSADNTTSALFGTTGYIPPEYGVSAKVSTKGDVFNYGILLLELLTKRRPTFRFQGDVSLREWVRHAADDPDTMLTILDSSIQNELAVHEDQIQLIVKVGLLCTESSPAKRPSMREVRDMLMQIGSLSKPNQKGR